MEVCLWYREEIKMNFIVRNTRNIDNIKILKLRDRLYTKAKRVNNLIFIIGIIPIIYTLIINFMPIEFEILEEMSIDLNEIGLIISIFISSIIYVMSEIIGRYKLESNILRQAYDCKVFNIRGNKFILSEKTYIALNKIEVSKKDIDYYEYWYGNEFGESDILNILICQVDNLLYTVYSYRRLKKTLSCIIFIIISILIFIIIQGTYTGELTSIFLKLIIPCTPIFSVVISKWSKLEKNVVECRKIIDEIKRDIERGLVDTLYLEAIQDKILINRLNDILIPKILREYYLKENNEYKVILKEFKVWIKEIKLEVK